MHTFRILLVTAIGASLGLRSTLAQSNPPPSRLANISARTFTGTGNSVLIAGFVMNGTNSRPMMIRAVGPGLAPFGVSDYVLDPELTLFRTSSQELTNDTWGSDGDLIAAFRRLGAFDLTENSRDAALLIPLAPGSYTAQARGRNGGTGQVLLELYDAAAPDDDAPAIVNVSLRGQLTSPNAVLIGGFVVSDGAPKRVLVRAIGPGLAQFGVAGTLPNPRVRLFSGGSVILQNDDWVTGNDPTTLEQTFTTTGAFSLSRTSKDAAFITSLPPGSYTAWIDDPTGGTGIVLCEVYDLNPPPPGSPPATGGGSGTRPTVSIVTLNERITEGVTPGASVMVLRSGDLSNPLRVYLRGSGTATPDDYTGLPASITIPAGSATASFIVGAWADNTWEPTETLTISITPDPSYDVTSVDKTTLVISDATPLNGEGWLGEYFNNKTLTGSPVLTRIDPQINFTTWGGGSPGPGVNTDGFSVRWTGSLQVDTTQDYTFVTRTDDGVRLYVDNKLLIDKFVNQNQVEWSATVTLTAGVRYPVRMEYYDNSSTAYATLTWQAAGMPRALIDQNRIFQGGPFAPAVTSPTAAIAILGGSFTYNTAATPTPLSFAATSLPPGLAIDTATGVISGTPTMAGTYFTIVSVANALGTGSELVTISVIDAGAKPTSETWTAAATAFIVPTSPPAVSTSLASLQSMVAANTSIERIRGYITAPLTGDYTFWISASGPAQFNMADSGELGDRVLRASVPVSSPAQGWTTNPAQKSMTIALVAGEKYFFEVLHRPLGTSPHVEIGWSKPGDPTTAPSEIIPGYALSHFDPTAPAETGKELYLATLRPDSGALTPASGSASLLYDDAAKSATISMRFSGLSSTEVAAYLSVGDVGQIGPLIQALPGGQFTSFTWQINASGSLSVQDLVDAIRNGLLYVEVFTGSYPGGELRGQFGAAAGSSDFTPPPAPPALPTGNPDANAASRFLQQATFGPRQADIDHLTQVGYDAWLNEQFNTAPTLNIGYIDARTAELALLTPVQNVNQDDRQRIWWKNAVTAADQLRQRVAFALSEIFVVSDVGTLNGEVVGLSTYYDMLLKDCFGNFRTLLEEVTLSPAMGNYLSMIRNRKADPARGIYPDENYAREVQQLFTIGLNKLHPDGTLVLDSSGLPIPTYTQDTIVGFAHVFTGWGYYSTKTSPSYLGEPRDFRNPMMMYPTQHDMSDKRALESWVIPGGADGTADLKTVLDMLYNHPNVGPFISKQLIQRLVTSNPSPGYVYRVAQVFADNGFGVRGDLKAVVRAILMDYEARSLTSLNNQSFGKIREPLVRVAQLWRAFNGSAADGTFSYTNPQNNFGEAALRSTTVFNFFEPGYVAPGLLATAGLVAPEMQITTDTTIVGISNSLRGAIFNTTGLSNVVLDFSGPNALASNPAALVDWLNTLLMGGTMSSGMRSTVITAVTAIPVATANERARTALNLITSSPEYSVQK